MNLYRSVKKQEGGGTGGTDVYIDGVKSTASRVDMLSLIKAPFVLSSASYLVVDNELHVFSSQLHYKWNGTTWSEVSTLPISNTATGCFVYYDNHIYIIGGVNAQTTPYMYKLDNTTWTQVSDLPLLYAGQPIVAVVYNNEIHIFGSSYNDTTSNVHYKWNGTAWSEVSTMPFKLRSGSAVIYNNEIHVMGGSSTDGYYNHYKWNGTAWSEVSTMPYSFNARNCAVVFDNKIYVMGSDAYNRDDMFKYSMWNGTAWSEVEQLPLQCESAVVYNNSIYYSGNNNLNYLVKFGLDLILYSITQ